MTRTREKQLAEASPSLKQKKKTIFAFKYCLAKMHNKYVQILLRNIIVFRVWFPAHPWNNYLWLLHNTRVTPFCKGELIKEYVYDVLHLAQVCVCDV